MHISCTATTLQRVGERFRTVPSGADRRGLSNSAAGVTTTLRLRARTHSRDRQQTNRLVHISRLNYPEENEAGLVPMVEEKLLEHRSSTATTLQRVGERFRTVPSGADRRGLSNSAAGVTTALRLRARTHTRNRQQTNRSWIHSSSDCHEDNKAYLVPKVEEKLLEHKRLNHQISFVRGETTDAETCCHGGPHIHKEDCGIMHSSARQWHTNHNKEKY